MSRNKNEHGGRRWFARIAAVAAVIGAGVSQRDKLRSLWQKNSGKIPELIRNRSKKR